MRIAILGTRGIPNNYGGFEQFAEYLAMGLVKNGHEIVVFNSHDHPYKKSKWNNINIVHIYDPEYLFGTLGQFFYDLRCITRVKKYKCDIILQLGYTSSSIWGWLLSKESISVTNMDGLEWKRTKFSKPIKRFLQFAEKKAVYYSDYLISDSIGIQDYIKEKYGKSSTYIPYGADVFSNPEMEILFEYDLLKHNYDMLIARLEPENSIEIILDGAGQSSTERPFIVIGNYNTKYGMFLKNKYRKISKIRFLGGIYNIRKLNNLRFYSNMYFHGHTVGGTNPSLLEAMASSCLISAFNIEFNKWILGNDAFYFTNSEEVKTQLNSINKQDINNEDFINRNILKIQNNYSWQKIVDQYESLFKLILRN